LLRRIPRRLCGVDDGGDIGVAVGDHLDAAGLGMFAEIQPQPFQSGARLGARRGHLDHL
jgi:hypothetical protein